MSRLLTELPGLLEQHGRLAMATVVSAVGLDAARDRRPACSSCPDGSTRGDDRRREVRVARRRGRAEAPRRPRPSFHARLRLRARRARTRSARSAAEPRPSFSRSSSARRVSSSSAQATAAARSRAPRRFTGWDVTVADERPEQLDPAAFPEGARLVQVKDDYSDLPVPAPRRLRRPRLARPRDGRTRVPAPAGRPARVSRDDRQQGEAKGPLRRAARRGVLGGGARPGAQPHRPRRSGPSRRRRSPSRSWPSSFEIHRGRDVSGFPKPRGRVLVLAALSAAAFAYAAVRAVRIPIVHDEALTYFLFVAGRYAGHLEPGSTFEVNNHFLNSVLSADVPAALRGRRAGPPASESPLPAALSRRDGAPRSPAADRGAHGGGVPPAQRGAPSPWSSSLSPAGTAWASRSSRRAWRCSSTLSNGRGAGTARAGLAFLCLGLASLANLSFLLPLVAAWRPGPPWKRGDDSRAAARELPALRETPSLLVPLALSLPFLIVLVPYATELSRRGRFNMGGSRGLWSDTAVSLLAVLRNLPPEEAPRAPLLEAVLAAVLLLLAAAVLVRPGRLSPLSLVPASLLALTTAGIGARAADSSARRYPVERAALPVQFLFLAAATGVAGDWIAERRSGWKSVSAAVLLSAVLAVAAFAAARRDDAHLIWRYDADNPRMLDDLDRARRERGVRPTRAARDHLADGAFDQLLPGAPASRLAPPGYPSRPGGPEPGLLLLDAEGRRRGPGSRPRRRWRLIPPRETASPPASDLSLLRIRLDLHLTPLTSVAGGDTIGSDPGKRRHA